MQLLGKFGKNRMLAPTEGLAPLRQGNPVSATGKRYPFALRDKQGYDMNVKKVAPKLND